MSTQFHNWVFLQSGIAPTFIEVYTNGEYCYNKNNCFHTIRVISYSELLTFAMGGLSMFYEDELQYLTINKKIIVLHWFELLSKQYSNDFSFSAVEERLNSLMLDTTPLNQLIPYNC